MWSDCKSRVKVFFFQLSCIVFWYSLLLLLCLEQLKSFPLLTGFLLVAAVDGLEVLTKYTKACYP